jgi:hypothetical protein
MGLAKWKGRKTARRCELWLTVRINGVLSTHRPELPLSTRTDVHRPSAINPGAKGFVRMTSLTTAQHKRTVERARKRWDASTDAIYAAAEHDNERFYDITVRLGAEHPAVVEHETARRGLFNAEIAAVHAGKGWNDDRGHFHWYSTRDLQRFAGQRRRGNNLKGGAIVR